MCVCILPQLAPALRPSPTLLTLLPADCAGAISRVSAAWRDLRVVSDDLADGMAIPREQLWANISDASCAWGVVLGLLDTAAVVGELLERVHGRRLRKEAPPQPAGSTDAGSGIHGGD